MEEERQSFIFQLTLLSSCPLLGTVTGEGDSELTEVLLSEDHHFLVDKARGGKNTDRCPDTLVEVNLEKSTW